MILLILFSALFHMPIGFLPGTCETATMAPIAMILFVSGIDPIPVFAWSDEEKTTLNMHNIGGQASRRLKEAVWKLAHLSYLPSSMDEEFPP